MSDSDDGLFVRQPNGSSRSDDTRSDGSRSSENLASHQNVESGVTEHKESTGKHSAQANGNAQVDTTIPEAVASKPPQETNEWQTWSALHLGDLERTCDLPIKNWYNMEKNSRPELKLPDWPVVVFGPRQKIERLSKRGSATMDKSSLAYLDPHTAAVFSFKADVKAFKALPTPGTLDFVKELQQQIIGHRIDRKGDLLVVTATHKDLAVRDTLWVLNVPFHRREQPYHWQWLVSKDLVETVASELPRHIFNSMTNHVLVRLQQEGATSGKAVLEMWGEIMNYAVEDDNEGIMQKIFPDVKETGGRSTLNDRTDLTCLLLKQQSTQEYAPELYRNSESGRRTSVTHPNSGVRIRITNTGTSTVISVLDHRVEAEAEEQEEAAPNTHDEEDDKMTAEEEAAKAKQAKEKRDKEKQRKRKQQKRQKLARQEAKSLEQAGSPPATPGLEAAEVSAAGGLDGEGTSKDCPPVTALSPVSPELATQTAAIEEASNSPVLEAIIDAGSHTSAVTEALVDEGSDGEAVIDAASHTSAATEALVDEAIEEASNSPAEAVIDAGSHTSAVTEALVDKASDGEASPTICVGQDQDLHEGSPGIVHLADAETQVNVGDGAELAALDHPHENPPSSEDDDTESCVPVQMGPSGEEEDQRIDDSDSEPEDDARSTSMVHLADAETQVLGDGAKLAALDQPHENQPSSEDDDTESCVPVQMNPSGEEEDQLEYDSDSEPEDDVGSTSRRSSTSAAGAVEVIDVCGDQPEVTEHDLEEASSIVDATTPLPPSPPPSVKKVETVRVRQPVPFKLPPVQPALPDYELLKRHIRRNQGIKTPEPERHDSTDEGRGEQPTVEPAIRHDNTDEGREEQPTSVGPSPRHEYRFPIPLTVDLERAAYLRAETRSVESQGHMSEEADRDEDAPEHDCTCHDDFHEEEAAQRPRAQSLPRSHRFKAWSGPGPKEPNPRPRPAQLYRYFPAAEPAILPFGLVEPPLNGVPALAFADAWAMMGWMNFPFHPWYY